MMSAVGIDFGNENSYIAVAKSGVIETITNDYSQRSTPSYVAFGKACRDLGTSAKNKYITNLKNTVGDFKRLIGKKITDPILQHEISYLPYMLHELPNGSLGVKVSYLDKDVIFTVHQITAMMFTKLKNIAESALNTKVTDCVVSVPTFFTDAERRAMLDVCKIAGLHVLRLLNENVAVALAYGFYRQDFSNEKAKKVAFIDIGHSAVQATVCEFTDRKLKILANTWDFCLGGRDIDNAMVRHFSQEFQSKYKLDVLSNSRAIIRLLQECEKLKKHLSVNPQVLPLNIECFMEDKDVSSSLGREKLEELCSDIFSRVENVFKRLLFESNLRPEDISCVEVVGGTTRIPAIKALIKRVFKQEPSTTLNLDEAVARGCALQAALLSPALKVKQFSISDVQPYPIKLEWDISESEKGNIEVFPKSHPIPFSKLLTFFRKEDFCLEAYYCTGDKSYPDVLIGSFLIQNVNQTSSGDSAKVLVKLRMNIHGIFTIRSAVIVEKDFKVNTVLDQKTEDLLDIQLEGLSGQEACAPAIVNEEKKSESLFSLKRHKKVPKEIELKIEAKVPELSESEMKTLIEREQKMIQQDQRENNRIDAKNSVEEYIYELRNQLNDTLGKYVQKEEFQDLMHKLDILESWIYEEGEYQSEEIYLNKLYELKAVANPIIERKHEHENCPAAIEDFKHLIQGIQNICIMYLSGSEQYSHIEPKNMEMIQRIVDENNSWLQEHLHAISGLQCYQDPPVTSEKINKVKENLKMEVSQLLKNAQKNPPEQNQQ